jgi:hypothetical protein
MSMSEKITRNNRFLIILLGISVCILLQGFIIPSLQLSAWDIEISSISQSINMDGADPSIPLSANFSSRTALFESLLYSSHLNVFLSAIPQIIHDRSPPPA